MAVSTQQLISGLYVAFFNRAPDQSGLQFWTDAAVQSQLTDNALARTIAQGFATHPFFTTAYGDLGNAAFIDAVYVNIGGAPADEKGKAFWLDAINKGLTRADFVADFTFLLLNITVAELQTQLSNGDITQEEYDNAILRQDRLTNKSEVGLKFVETMGAGSNLSPNTNPLDPASLANDPAFKASQAIIAGVTEDDATKDSPTQYLNGAPTLEGILEQFGTPTEPTGPTYELTAAAASVNEGDTVLFNLATTNVAAGTTLTYTISGVQAADVVGGQLTGTVTTDAQGRAALQVGLVNDLTTEGAENLTVTINGSNATVTVSDTSLTPAGNFNLSAGVDTQAGGDVNDTYTASDVAQLNPLDTFNAGGGTNTLRILDVGVVDNNGAPMPNKGLVDAQFAGIRNIQTLETTTLSNTLGANAATAGINTVTLRDNLNIGKTVDLTGFNGPNVTINGASSTAPDQLTLSLADAGNKTANLGGGQDQVNVNGGSATPVLTTFLSAGVGNGTAQNVTIAGPNGNVVLDDEGVTIVGDTANQFNVVGLAADGTVDQTQNRGNFQTLMLGTSAADNLTTVGAAGNVYINAGSGNDTLTSVAAAGARHFLVGGAGNDTLDISGDGATVAITGGGNDTVNVTAGNGQQNISLTSGVNVVTFANGTLVANQANPAAPAVNTNDVVTGGTDATDTLRASATDAAAAATNGADANSVRSISGIEVLSLTNALGANSVNLANVQTGLNELTLEAGAGAGTATFTTGGKLNLASGAGGDINVAVTGAGTTDSLTIANTAAATNAFAGGAVTANGIESLTINGSGTGNATTQTLGSVTLAGTGAAATSVAVSGSNNVTTGLITAGTLTAAGLTGGAGLTASTSAANITGSAGNDNIVATAGTVTANLDAGNDDFTSTVTGEVNLNGGAGSDTFRLGTSLTSADIIDGGSERDTLVVGSGAYADGIFNHITNVEVFTAGAGSDVVFNAIANARAFDTVNLAGGSNTLALNEGFGRALTVNLGAGADTVTVNPASATVLTVNVAADNLSNTDAITAVAGRANVLNVTAVDGATADLTDIAPTPVSPRIQGIQTLNIVDAGTGATPTNPVVNTTVSLGTDSSLTTVNGAGVNDNLTINAAQHATTAITITTGSGADKITGSDVANTINAGEGADSVFGGIVGDRINGDAGNDVIFGGNGADVLNGGAGNDQFTYAAVSNSSGTVVDTIEGFEAVDSIVISSALLGGRQLNFAGNQANFGAAQGATTAGDNLIDFVLQVDTNTLWVDINNDGTLNADDIQIKLSGITAIAQSNVTQAPVVIDAAGTIATAPAVARAFQINNTALGGNIIVDNVDSGATTFGAITPAVASIDTLRLGGNTNLSGAGTATFASVTLDPLANLTVTAAQHTAFVAPASTLKTGIQTVVVSNAATLAGVNGIETYVIQGGSTFTLGTAAQNVAEDTAGNSTIDVNGLTATGTFGSFGVGDTLRATTTASIAGANGGTAFASVVNFGNADGVTLTMTQLQHAALVGGASNTTNTQTITLTTSGVVNGLNGVETYNLANGDDQFTVGSVTQNVNGNDGDDSFNFAAGDYTGNISGGAGSNVANAVQGTDFSATTANLSNIGTLNLTGGGAVNVGTSQANFDANFAVINGGAGTEALFINKTGSFDFTNKTVNANMEKVFVFDDGTTNIRMNNANVAALEFIGEDNNFKTLARVVNLELTETTSIAAKAVTVDSLTTNGANPVALTLNATNLGANGVTAITLRAVDSVVLGSDQNVTFGDGQINGLGTVNANALEDGRTLTIGTGADGLRVTADDITGANKTLTVNSASNISIAAAIGSDDNLTLGGNGNKTVTGFTGDLITSSGSGALDVTFVGTGALPARVVTVDSAAGASSNVFNIAGLGDPDTFILTGGSTNTIGATINNVNDTDVNTAMFTGNVTFNGIGAEGRGDAQPLNVAGGAGADVFNVAASTGLNVTPINLVTGLGMDNVNINSTADATAINYAGNAAYSNLASMDVITGFRAGVDDIKFQAAGQFSLQTVATADASTLGAALQNAANAANLLNVANWDAAGDVLLVVVQGGAAAGTYALVNDGANGLVTNDDLVVKLVGTVGSLTAADFIA